MHVRVTLTKGEGTNQGDPTLAARRFTQRVTR